MIALSLFLMSGLLANLAAKTESVMIQSNITKLLIFKAGGKTYCRRDLRKTCR